MVSWIVGECEFVNASDGLAYVLEECNRETYKKILSNAKKTKPSCTYATTRQILFALFPHIPCVQAYANELCPSDEMLHSAIKASNEFASEQLSCIEKHLIPGSITDHVRVMAMKESNHYPAIARGVIMEDVARRLYPSYTGKEIVSAQLSRSKMIKLDGINCRISGRIDGMEQGTKDIVEIKSRTEELYESSYDIIQVAEYCHLHDAESGLIAQIMHNKLYIGERHTREELEVIRNRVEKKVIGVCEKVRDAVMYEKNANELFEFMYK
jgi:hypothetical protein